MGHLGSLRFDALVQSMREQQPINVAGNATCCKLIGDGQSLPSEVENGPRRIIGSFVVACRYSTAVT